MRLLLLFLLFPLIALPSFAGDGVVEINQACATQTGCFPGDDPGFPVTITGAAGRSYRLTGDLAGSDAAVDVILVSTKDVTLDLGGFRIACRVFTPPATIEFCGESRGIGSGVKVSSSAQTGLAVSNGSLVGIGRDGVVAGDHAVVERVRVSECGGSGILTGAGSLVSGNTSNANFDDGIVTGDGSSVLGNTVFGNGVPGFTSSAGIRCAKGCNIRGNSSKDNSGHGISLGSESAFGDNVVSRNDLGTVSGGVDAGGNVCNGGPLC